MSVRIGVLLRHEDETGVSGEGIVANVVEFPDGTCIAHWRSATPSTILFPNLKQMAAVHGHGGKTEVVFYAELDAPADPAQLRALLEPSSEEESTARVVEEVVSEISDRLRDEVARKAARTAAKKVAERLERKPDAPQ